MAHHQRLAEATGMKVFFADPHAPWQRGSNENTNGLLRQYLPRGASMSGFDQDALDEVADRLNNRPRKTLGFATPAEEFSRLIDQSQDADMAMEPEGVRYGS
jgi:IS30 family transposase